MRGLNGRATTGWSPAPLRLRRRRQPARLEAPVHEAPAGCGEEQERDRGEDQQGQRDGLRVRRPEPLDYVLDDALRAALAAAAARRRAAAVLEGRRLAVAQGGKQCAMDVVRGGRIELDVLRQVVERILV